MKTYTIESLDIFNGWSAGGARRKKVWRVRENGFSIGGYFESKEVAEEFVEEQKRK